MEEPTDGIAWSLPADLTTNCMSLPDASPSTTTAAAAGALGPRMMRGASWILIQSVIGQLLSIGARIVMFRVITKEEIATASWSMSACVFLTWIQPRFGEVLIQGQRSFNLSSHIAFRLSVGLGILLVLIGCMVGPLLGWLYGSWETPVFIGVTALAMAVNAVCGVWLADLAIRFEFRKSAVIVTLGAILMSLLTIGMAYLGLRGWAIVLPPLAANILMLLLYVRASTFRYSRDVADSAGRAEYVSLMKSGMLLSLAGFCSNLMLQADNVFVGIYHKTQLAEYMLAYAMCFQLMQLLSSSLRGVMLPAFSQIGEDHERRDAAFLETVELAAFISMPVALLPIPAAHAAVVSIFSSKWISAVPLVQTFMMGMGFVVVYAAAYAFMQSRGLFKRFLATNIIMGGSFCLIIWPTAAWGDPRTVAIAVMLIYGVNSLLVAWAASAPCPRRFMFRIGAGVYTPLVIAASSAGAGTLLADVSGFRPNSWAYALIGLTGGCVLYLLLALLFMRRTSRSAWRRLGQTIPERFRARLSRSA